MKVLTVTYSMLRTTQRYENDRCEVTVEVSERNQEGVDAAVAEAKRQCAKALGKPDPVSGVELSDIVRAVGQAGARGIGPADLDVKLGVDRSVYEQNKARTVVAEALRLKLIKSATHYNATTRYYAAWVDPPPNAGDRW